MEKEQMLFNIYYINFPKVYEIKMMLSNIIGEKIELQTNKGGQSEEEIKAKLGTQFLTLFSSTINANKRTLDNESQKVLESFEIKMTKSTVLSEVLERSKKITCFEEDSINEGSLICIENVKLSLENEMELRTVKIFSNGTFKGMQIPEAGGLDINNIFNSIFKDYAYKLRGDTERGERILIKIPMTFESEFENLYSVDDLFVGKVTIIGIYKGKMKVDDLKNSFQFFQELGEENQEKEEEVWEIQSSQYEEHVKKMQFISSNDGKEYNYIDILAIIQEIDSEEEVKDNNDKNTTDF